MSTRWQGGVGAAAGEGCMASHVPLTDLRVLAVTPIHMHSAISSRTILVMSALDTMPICDDNSLRLEHAAVCWALLA